MRSKKQNKIRGWNLEEGPSLSLFLKEANLQSITFLSFEKRDPKNKTRFGGGGI